MTIQRVHCPTCGSFAERQELGDRLVPGCDYVVRTECSHCDYLLVMSLSTGNVIEAYAPGQSITDSETDSWSHKKLDSSLRQKSILSRLTDASPHTSMDSQPLSLR